ncbi:MAG: Ig-like domain-containing protein, partial [Gemmatimonadales bacterium]
MGRAPAERGLVGNVWKWGGGVLSTCAALVSILSYAHSFRPDAHATELLADSAVRWVGILPGADTASSIQDTIQLAATVKDERGNALPGAATVWSSLDTAVASVDGSGTVVARGEGTATIVASVGGRVAHARIAVRQQPHMLRMVGDTVLRVSEGGGQPAAAVLTDARSHEIGGRALVWRTADPSVAQVDSLGQVAGIAAGHTTITATHEQLVANLKVEV